MMRLLPRQAMLISYVLLCLLLFLAIPNQGNLVHANPPITPSGLNTQISGPIAIGGHTQYNITGGTRPGNGLNLFHSFGDFNVPNNNIANFFNDSGLATANILGRVTGGNISNIFGTIQTTSFGNANLFLMNPAGFLFGPNATVNVGGMVTFTSADYMRLADGARFTAVPNAAADALLSAAPVAAFGFLGSNPGAITVQGSQLSVAEGTGISLIGGNITLQSGTLDNGTRQDARLSAPGGQINLVSVGTPQHPTATQGGEVLVNAPGLPPFTPTGFASLGNVTVSKDAGSLPFGGLDASGQSGGTIRIRGGQLEIINARIVADTTGSGTGGSVVLDGQNVTIINNHGFCCPGEDNRIGAGLPSFPTTGQPGSVLITGTQSVTLTGAVIGAASGPHTVSFHGPVTIEAPNLTINGTSFLLAGREPVAAQLNLLGTNVAITNSEVANFESFAPVDVRIMARQSATLDHTIMNLSTAGDLRSSVTIGAKDIVMTGTRIDTSRFVDSRGSTDGGPITLTATHNVTLDQSFLLSSGGAVPGLDGTSGGGGTIRVTAGHNILLNSSLVNVSTLNDGLANITHPAGNILLWAGNNITLNTSTLSADIYNQNIAGTAGNAGNIWLGAGNNLQINQSTLSAQSRLLGDAGTILLGAGNNVFLNTSTVSADSHGLGNAGTIAIGAGNNINVNMSTISAQSDGPGQAGTVLLGAGNNILLDTSVVSAVNTGTGTDGSILLGAGNQIILNNSTVTPAPTIVSGENME